MVTIALSWRCLGSSQIGVGHIPCDAGGEGDGSDLAAHKHMDANPTHGTVVTGRPA